HRTPRCRARSGVPRLQRPDPDGPRREAGTHLLPRALSATGTGPGTLLPGAPLLGARGRRQDHRGHAGRCPHRRRPQSGGRSAPHRGGLIVPTSRARLVLTIASILGAGFLVGLVVSGRMDLTAPSAAAPEPEQTTRIEGATAPTAPAVLPNLSAI